MAWAASLALVPVTVRGDDCVDYRDYMKRVGGIGGVIDAGANDLVVTGSYAYLAQFGRVTVARVSTPTTPSIAGQVLLPGPAETAHGLAVAGNYLYIAAHATGLSSGLRVARITNPTIPQIVGSGVETPGTAFDVAVAGTLAYVADGTAGLRVVDVQNPFSLVLLGGVTASPAQARAVDVAVAGNHAYVAYEAAGLVIVDVSNPAAPVIVGSVPALNNARGVAIAGSYAYVADFVQGLQVVDVSNPALPVVVGSLDVFCEGVAVDGTHAFITIGTAGIAAVDISNPASPVFVGRVHTEDLTRAVAVNGTHAYAAATVTFHVIDIATPSSPPLAATVTGGGWEVGAAAAAGNYAYLLGDSSFLVVDISDPSSPQILGSVGAVTGADVVVSGSYAYALLLFPTRLLVIDVSNPAAPASRGTVALPDLTTRIGLAVNGNHAYVADGSAGLIVVDVSNPSSPAVIATANTPGSASWVALGGAYAYVADGPAGLQVVDVSNPASPVIVGGVDTPGSAEGVAISGINAYVADGTAGLRVVRILDPLHPMLTGSLALPTSGVSGVTVSGEVAYLTGGDLYAVSIFPAPTILGEGGIRGTPAARVAVSGDYLLAVGLDYGVSILPGHCPAASGVPPSSGPSALSHLAQNRPNPFGSTSGPTEIRFVLPSPVRAKLRVFATSGRLVRVLLDEQLAGGEHMAWWDGRDDQGKSVGSGVYYYRLDAGSLSVTRTLVKVR